MGRRGWSKAQDKYASQMRANITATVKKCVMKHVGEYVARLQAGIDGDDLKKLLYKKFLDEHGMLVGLEDKMLETIRDVRARLGVTDAEALPKKLKGDITIELFRSYVHLAKIRHMKKSLLPFAKYGHKFAYLDKRMTAMLFSKGVFRKKRPHEDAKGEDEETLTGNTLEDIFDFTTASTRRRGRAVQKRKRGSRSVKKKHGMSLFIHDKQAKSVLADGVSIFVRLKTSIPLPTILRRMTKSDPKPPKLADKLKADLECYIAEDEKQPVFIGVDYGRAKLYSAAFECSDEAKPKTIAFTRLQY